MFEIWSDPFSTWQWVSANLCIAAAYAWIGVRHLVKHGGIGWLYGAFILSCGLGHALMVAFMGFWPTRSIWFGVVFLDTLTALVSVSAAARIKKTNG